MKDFSKSYRIIRLTKNGGHCVYSPQWKTWFGWMYIRDKYEDDWHDEWAHKMKFSKKSDAVDFINKRIKNREYRYEDRINGKEVIVGDVLIDSDNLMVELLEFINDEIV